MARTARELSGSNIYHAMLRGVNRQDIFEDDEDRNRFMTVLTDCKKISGFRLHAFVLMSNHVHLLIEPVEEPLDLIFRRIGTRYAVWYNRRHERAGHLFQDRFRTEKVESTQYFMTVLRYILLNPMKAGLEDELGTYRWSSFRAYGKGSGQVTDTQFATDVFGGREALDAFLREQNDDKVMDEEDCDWRLRDDEAKAIMKRVADCDTAAGFQLFDSKTQKLYAGRLYREGLSMGQIARLTGMSKTTVSRAVKEGEAAGAGEMEIEPGFRESGVEYTAFDPDTVW